MLFKYNSKVSWKCSRPVLQKHFCKAMRTEHQLYFHYDFVNGAMKTDSIIIKTDSIGRCFIFQRREKQELQNNECIFKMRAR